MPDPMWNARPTELDRPGLKQLALFRGDRAATFRDVLEGWRADPTFCRWFNDVLADLPFAAFRWETPPVVGDASTRMFEFVALDAPGLARRADRAAFAEHFDGARDVVAFENLGGDAQMIVPSPIAGDDAYGHLAAFVRNAPEAQRISLWRSVADALLQRIGPRPVWLSTAGAGVAWLHVRLDDRPKYYGFAAYRTPP